MDILGLECRKCGAPLVKDGKQYKCEYCDIIYLVSSDSEGQLFAYQPVEKKHIQSGQMAVRASTIQVNEVVVRQIKLDDDIETQVAQETTEITKRDRLGLLEGYLADQEWEKVDEHVNGLLLEDANCSEAKWYGWMSEKKVADDRQMLSKLSSFTQADAIRLDQLLQYASPAFAKRIIDLFFNGAFANDDMCYYALSVILPYGRNEAIYTEQEFSKKVGKAYDEVIGKTYVRAFDYLLENTLRPEDVDAYISYVMRFAENCGPEIGRDYYAKVIAVDPGNLKAHKKLIRADIAADTVCSKTLSDMEQLIAYSDSPDREVLEAITQLCSENITTENKSDLMFQLLGYHSAAPMGLKEQILTYGRVLLESQLWRQAKHCFNLVLSFDSHCGDAYWGLRLTQMEAKNDQDAIRKKEPINAGSTYDKALAVYRAAGDTQKVSYLRELAQKQKGKKAHTKKLLITGAALFAIILIFIIGGKISNAVKYSAHNIKLTLVNAENVQEPLTEFDIQIKNGCTEDLSGMEITFRFYDNQNALITATNLRLSGYMAAKEEKQVNVTLHNDVVGELYWYHFEELKITVEIISLDFNELWNDPETNGKEKVLKKAQKPDQSKITEIEKKLSDAFKIFDAASVTDADFEAQATEFGAALDEIWEDVVRNKTLLQTMYEKAEEYQKDAEYEKAYCVFALLAAEGYEDSEDKAYECAMSIGY